MDRNVEFWYLSLSTFSRKQTFSYFSVLQIAWIFFFSIIGLKQFDGFNEAYGFQTYKCSESEDDDNTQDRAEI